MEVKNTSSTLSKSIFDSSRNETCTSTMSVIIRMVENESARGQEEEKHAGWKVRRRG